MWRTQVAASHGESSVLWAGLFPGSLNDFTTAPGRPIISDWSLNATRYAPPLMPRPLRPNGSTMREKLRSLISGGNWMNSDDPSNTPNDDQPEIERSAADVAKGLEEVVHLNRQQFEAFTAIRKDLADLTQRIKGGNLLLLPRTTKPHSPSRRKRGSP